MESYIILTNKDDYATRLDSPGIEPVETYEYHFYDRCLAEFTVAKVKSEEARAVIEDKEDITKVCNIPSRLFPSFESLESAREEIQQLVGPGRDYVKLVKKG